MDRNNLKAWLTRPSQTWRWILVEGDPNQYQAVEINTEGLQWYQWSHHAEAGGKQNVQKQTHEEFAQVGPPVSVPEHVKEEIKAWIEEKIK